MNARGNNEPEMKRKIWQNLVKSFSQDSSSLKASPSGTNGNSGVLKYLKDWRHCSLSFNKTSQHSNISGINFLP